MTREELLTHCKYYKGEENCPFEDSLKRLFWRTERMFVDNATHDDSFRLAYEGRAKRYIKENPNKQNFLTDKNVSITTKAIVLYIEDIMQKWCPYGDFDDIFKY